MKRRRTDGPTPGESSQGISRRRLSLWSVALVVWACPACTLDLGQLSHRRARDLSPSDGNQQAREKTVMDGSKVDGSKKTCSWLSGTPKLDGVDHLDNLSSPSFTEGGVTLNADETVIYFCSNRDDGAGHTDFNIWTAKRADKDQPFGAPVLFQKDVISTVDNDEYELAVSPNELDGYLVRQKDGKSEILIFKRETTELPFALRKSLAVTVPPNGYIYDPFPSPDNLRLYFSIEVYPPRAGGTECDSVVYYVERGSPGVEFGSQKMEIPGLGAAPENCDSKPTITDDRTVIVFDSRRAGGSGSADIWYGTYDAQSKSFTHLRSIPIGDINTDRQEAGPFITGDGCTLYFSRAPSAGAKTDLYRARFSPQ